MSGFTCTGVAAVWCPVHGDCECADLEDLNDEGCPLHSSGSTHASPVVIGDVALSRYEYLQIIVKGYSDIDADPPAELLAEYKALVEEELAKLKAQKRAQLEAERQQMIEWEAQRGRRMAGALNWWERYGQEPQEITEVEETDEERELALRNLRKARRQQGFR
jgi:hypothetical protein